MKIEVKNVSKSFKNENVLNDVNLEFRSGKIYGLVGYNGSGKSVLLKMICAFYKPTTGEILINNKNYNKLEDFPNEIRAFIEKPSFLPNLTGYENLKLLANLYKEKDKQFSKYSLGMKQKLAIASVLMENPEIMIFDEPFNGIDENSKSNLFEILKNLKKNKIIIVSSHIKEEIVSLCDIVYNFDSGKVKKQ